MTNRTIIISLIIFLLTSFTFLSYRESRMESLANQDWWSVSFVDPKSNSLDFKIENNSNSQNFHWELLADKEKINEGDVQISKGEKKEVKIEKSDPKGKIIIKVTNGSEFKELYKTF